MRFAAGFAHESQAFGEQLAIRSIIEERLDREVVIAAACGLGRRNEAAGRAVLEPHRGTLHGLRRAPGGQLTAGAGLTDQRRVGRGRG